MNTELLISFLIPTLALNLTPGPDLFFVIGQSTKGGPRAATMAALGLWLGYLFHLVLVCVGVAALMAQFPQALAILKWLGGSYLLYLGIKMLRQKAPADSALAEKPPSIWRGVLVSALNPKVAVFFLAFLPQFVSEGEGRAPLRLLALGLLFSFTSTLVNFSAGLGAHYLARPGRSKKHVGAFSLERVCGFAMIGMAAKLALLR